MNTLNNYDIKNKLFALTMDNTTTNKAVTQLLQRELPNVNIIFIGSIKEMCLKEPSMPPCLETEELAELESICQILKPFEDAIAVLSKDQSNPISDDLTDVIADHILIAHVLDPRYKMKYLRATIIDVEEYTENEANQYVNSVHEKIILYRTRYSISRSTTLTTIVNDVKTFSGS
ncbi:unnamed protein product [Rhizophagus irregularis]|nr:unnamed protein product [Rhizophagus irregularis]CAB5179477.1 unnamed protein product [Rhizophagus irregularis]CAB5392380.1 unnamed protein product [Rhizophagus irregularis]